MKKRFVALLLALAMVLSLTACGGSDSSSSGTAPEGSSSTAAERVTYTSAEAQTAAQQCFDSMKDLSGDALLEAFKTQQAELNYDGNTDEFFVTPESSLVDGFSDAVLSVKENEIALSEKTDYGYFVVMRLPLGEENLASVKQDYINELFSTCLNEAVEAAEVVESDVLKDLDYEKYFQYLGELQTTIDATYDELSETYTAKKGNEDAESEEIARAVEADLLAKLEDAVKEDCTAFLTDNALTADTTVLTVDGREIPASTYLYFMGYYKTYYNNIFNMYYQSDLDLSSDYSEDMTWLDFFKDLAKNYSVQYATAMNLAEKAGVKPTDEQRKEMEDSMSTAMESNMLYVGSTVAQAKKVLEFGLYGDAYQDSLYGENGSTPVTDEDVKSYAEENKYYNCRYILFKVEESTDK